MSKKGSARQNAVAFGDNVPQGGLLATDEEAAQASAPVERPIALDIDLDYFSFADPTLGRLLRKGVALEIMQDYDKIQVACGATCCEPRNALQYDAMAAFLDALLNSTTVDEAEAVRPALRASQRFG
jgi:hypothetical protein